MIELILLSLLQSLLLCGGQVLLKIALEKMGPFAWTWDFWAHSILLNWWWLGCGLAFLSGAVLWMYIIKNFAFSVAYPLTSLTYIFGMIAAMMLFHETVSVTQWVGILMIMGGCYLVAR
ncbi:MAG: EamA family transporter [Paludibacteraceae bacterium]|nr:EamA family transporter [Paludibacteraceae bacterium]